MGSACQYQAWARSDELREAPAGKTEPSEERPPYLIRERGHKIEVVAALTLRVDAGWGLFLQKAMLVVTIAVEGKKKQQIRV